MTEKDIDRNLTRRFLQSCQTGDLDRVRAVLEARGEQSDWTVYRHKSSGDTALHVAAREGRIHVVKYLCENCPAKLAAVAKYRPADVANLDMKKPMHEAAQFARYDVLEYLIQQGAEIDPLKRSDWTPLMLACTKSGTEAQLCVKKLLESGANVTLRNKDGWTPFLLACRAGDPVIIKQLLAASAGCIDDRSNNGRTALHIAAQNGCQDALEILVAAKPELMELRDSAGSTPLHESVKSLNFNVTDCLLKKGAKIGFPDKVGQSIVHVAASVGNALAVMLFVYRHQIRHDLPMHFGITPERLAQRYNQHEIVTILRNMDLNQMDITKFYPFKDAPYYDLTKPEEMPRY